MKGKLFRISLAIFLAIFAGALWSYAQGVKKHETLVADDTSATTSQQVIQDPNSKAIYYPKLSDALQHEQPINGINPKLYDGFWEKWHLVTARFRPDIGELRYVYANDLAWDVLKAGGSVYPPGAIFSKLAFKAEDDKLFPNSEIPSLSVRVQFMLKHAESYKSTNGWSFALYPRDLIEVKSASLENQTCFACHQIAKDRSYVFSVPFLRQTNIEEAKDFHQFFTDVKVSSLPENVQEALTEGGILSSDTVKAWKSLLFSGSLSESRRPLTLYAAEDKIAYALYDSRSGDYFVAIPLKGTQDCESMVMTLTRIYPEGYWEGKSKEQIEASKVLMCNGKVLSSDNFTK